MGYYYEEPKRGSGYSYEAKGFYRGGGIFYLGFLTKKSADQLRAQHIREGIDPEDISISKND
jgi:hypothetical protein